MAENANITEITEGTFETEVGGSDLTMVDFWAEWCGPCRMVAPVVEELAESYAEKGLKVGKVDVDENPRVAAQFGIRSIPTIVFFRDGTEVDRMVGFGGKAALEEKVQSHL